MGHARKKARYLTGGFRGWKVKPHRRMPPRPERPANYTARMFNGTRLDVESNQTGRGRPSTHSKRLKQVRR